MSPTLRPPEEVRLKRTAMSTRELRRAEVLARVKSETLRLVDAAKMLELSYRQAKRLWQRYREEGAKGLQHRSAGRGSNRAKPEKFRRKVLQLIREKYSGTEQERFGPTLAAEHLADEDGLEVEVESIAGVRTPWGDRLRYALNAPHKPRRRASLRRSPQGQQQIKRKGDTSNEVRKGTFLKRFDRALIRLPWTASLATLLPLPTPPFAGKTHDLAESLVHAALGPPILALGQGNSPSGGQHGNAKHSFSEPEIDCGSVPPRARPGYSLCQPGRDRCLHKQLRRHFGPRGTGDLPGTRSRGASCRTDLYFRSRPVFVESSADLGIILACDPHPRRSFVVTRWASA